MSFLSVEILLFSIWVLVTMYYNYSQKYVYISNRITIKKTNNLYLNLTFIFFALMVMLRGERIGNDTITYFIDYIRFIPFVSEPRYEPGFNLLYSLTKFCFSSPYAIIAVTGGITMALFYIFIRQNSKWFLYSIIIFVLLGFLDSCMNIVRQAIAAGIVGFSYKYVTEKCLIRFLICIAIASSFHITAIVFVIAWWVYKIKISKKTLLILSIAIIAAYIGFSTVLSVFLVFFSQYEDYKNSIFGEGAKIGALFQSGVYIFLLLLVYISYLIIGKTRFKKMNLDGILLLCMIGASIQLISYKMSIIGRIAIYYNIFQIILLPNILICLSRRNRILLSIIAFTVLNIYYWTILLLRPEWNIIYPYKTFL